MSHEVTEPSITITVPLDWRPALDVLRKELVAAALVRTQGHGGRAARLLGICPDRLRLHRTRETS